MLLQGQVLSASMFLVFLLYASIALCAGVAFGPFIKGDFLFNLKAGAHATHDTSDEGTTAALIGQVPAFMVYVVISLAYTVSLVGSAMLVGWV